MSAATIASRLEDVRTEIRQAAELVGRDPKDVRLIAVSKRHPVSVIREASEAGQTDFGENFVQELLGKVAELEADAPACAVTMHHIGHLQRNKVRQVVGVAHLLHGVDSERLLREISKRAQAAGLRQPILLEVNIAGEASKGGISPTEAKPLVELAHELDGVRLDGLMAMPPFVTDAEDNRHHFAALRRLRDQLQDRGPLPELSMGTTADYAVAVQEGATLVRVGTAVFGPRPMPV